MLLMTRGVNVPHEKALFSPGEEVGSGPAAKVKINYLIIEHKLFKAAYYLQKTYFLIMILT